MNNYDKIKNNEATSAGSEFNKDSAIETVQKKDEAGSSWRT